MRIVVFSPASRIRKALAPFAKWWQRNATEAAKFKAMGVRAGFPDLILCVARHGYHGLFVELKTDKGRQTDNQKYYQCVLEEQGYRYVVVRSLEEFINVINDYLGDDGI